MSQLPAIIEHVPVTPTQRYQILIDDLQGIIVEGIHNARWAFIKVYHDTGMRIMQDYPELDTAESYGKGITKRIANDLGKSQRMIQRSVQIARTWPDLSLLPEGKNISLHKLINKYLPKVAGESTRPITYYDGLATLANLHGPRGPLWTAELPAGTELEGAAAGNSVHVVIQEKS